MASEKKVLILMADDDQEDCMLARDALAESKLANDFVSVGDGEELLEYLTSSGRFEGQKCPRPGLILLDLNMPRMDGREALEKIKSDPELRRIPVVVLTTSRAERDVYSSYDLGANSYIMKPVTFASLVDVVKTLSSYWFAIVELPPDTAKVR